MARTESKHFTLEKLQEGVYSAFHREGGWATANAGIIDLGDSTIVFDTFLTPAAAVDLKIAAESLTGKPVSKVINSHYHNDHIWGNQVFARRSELISSVETRRLIETSGQEEYDWYKEHSKARLGELEQEFEASKDEGERRDLREWMTYYEGLAETMPELEVCLADTTFEDEFRIQGSDRSVELTSHVNAHTGNDTLLYLPSDGIIFMGDLLFVDCQPYLADGDAENLLAVIANIKEFAAESYVPGHGPTGARHQLDMMADYVHACFQAAEGLAKKGIDPENLPKLTAPQPFTGWKFPTFFSDNVRWLYERML